MKHDTRHEKDFIRKIGDKERRRLKAARDTGSIWSGLGLFGMVGWSVAIPTLLGIALGVWLDKRYPQSFSWVLTGLMTGLIVGCVIAWNWVRKERSDIDKHEDINPE